MRIIGGDLRGKNILPPANYGARPTTDFAKEGLFNILINEYDIEELSVLDLFYTILLSFFIQISLTSFVYLVGSLVYERDFYHFPLH